MGRAWRDRGGGSGLGCAGPWLGFGPLELGEPVGGVQFVPVLGEAAVADPPDVDAAHDGLLPGRRDTQDRVGEGAEVGVAPDHGALAQGADGDGVFADHLRVGKGREPIGEERDR